MDSTILCVDDEKYKQSTVWCLPNKHQMQKLNFVSTTKGKKIVYIISLSAHVILYHEDIEDTNNVQYPEILYFKLFRERIQLPIQ